MQNTSRQLLSEALSRKGLSLREMARRAGTSHATISAYMSGRKSPSMDTLMRIVGACDFAVDFDLRPRVREANGLSRGEELEAVLRLADEFPANPVKDPNYPKFPARQGDRTA